MEDISVAVRADLLKWSIAQCFSDGIFRVGVSLTYVGSHVLFRRFEYLICMGWFSCGRDPGLTALWLWVAGVGSGGDHSMLTINFNGAMLVNGCFSPPSAQRRNGKSNRRSDAMG